VFSVLPPRLCTRSPEYRLKFFHSPLENLQPKDEIPLVNLKIVIEPGEDGWFVAHCPSLKSCWSQGKTREEALKNVREAIDLYLTPLEGSLARRRG
jgi:predicted RNase H-like HicB family nuclease